MHFDQETCWTVIRGAAGGNDEARATLVQDYLAAVRAYLNLRWSRPPHHADIEDAVQDVFFDLFRDRGALHRLDPDRGLSFRAFLFGVTKNVALRYQERERRTKTDGDVEPDALAADSPSLSRAFDRAWAQCLLQRAARRQRSVASASGPPALRRIELLELRFRDGMKIREIANRWGEDPAQLHREFARARDEFKSALRAEIRFHGPEGTNVERQCELLLELLRD